MDIPEFLRRGESSLVVRVHEHIVEVARQKVRFIPYQSAATVQKIGQRNIFFRSSFCRAATGAGASGLSFPLSPIGATMALFRLLVMDHPMNKVLLIKNPTHTVHNDHPSADGVGTAWVFFWLPGLFLQTPTQVQPTAS